MCQYAQTYHNDEMEFGKVVFYAPVLTLASVWMSSIFNTLSHDDWPIMAQENEDFDFIECFTTTFLRAHSWLNWVDEDDDEVGLKEKPEDTRYIKKITSK